MAQKTRATAARKPRRKVNKNVTQGQAHIKSTFNNTIVSITDPSGAVILDIAKHCGLDTSVAASDITVSVNIRVRFPPLHVWRATD